MTDLGDTLEALKEAIQGFACAQSEEPVLLSEAVVLYECVSYSEDGEPARRIAYTIPTDNFSLSGALGLLDAGRFYIRRDIFKEDPDPDG